VVWPDNVDGALTEVKLSPTDMARVQELRAQVVEWQKHGDPDGAAAAEAAKIVGFQKKPTGSGCGGVRNTRRSPITSVVARRLRNKARGLIGWGRWKLSVGRERGCEAHLDSNEGG
jgi:hypothetical protein